MSQCQNSRITSVTITSYNVNLSMLQKRLLPFESYIALVTIERSESIVLSHVTLQIARRSANIIALVAVVWFFSWMIPYHVEFQLICSNARKFACCASIRFFPWVGSFVHPQIAGASCWIFTLVAAIPLFSNMLCHFVLVQMTWADCGIFTLIAMVWFHPSVFQGVYSEMFRSFGWIVTLCALVRFLHSVKKGVGLQVMFSIEWLRALRTTVLLGSIVGLLMIPKATTVCKRLRTLVTRLQIFHPCCVFQNVCF